MNPALPLTSSHAGRLWLKTILWNLVVLALIFGGMEAAIEMWLTSPQRAPGFVLSRLQEYYTLQDRNIVQYLAPGRWDPEMGYIYRPGDYVFANREFVTAVQINGLGVRDDATSLLHPRVVVLGDSHAFGWGVGQEENFPAILQQMTGLSVLNMAVSSYGTAREIKLLERYQPRQLDVLIIQYCENDYEENVAFLRDNNKLKTMSEGEYEQLTRQHRQTIAYYPGKHVLGFSQLLAVRIRKEVLYFLGKRGLVPREKTTVPGQQGDELSPARAFLGVVAATQVDLSQTRIVVMEMNAHNNNATGFIASLREEITRETYPEHIRRMVLLDLSSVLKADDYFLLDDHSRPSGHHKIAAALVPLVMARP